jgi:hypothetical protein
MTSIKSTVTALSGEYTVRHPDNLEASAIVRALEEEGKIPFRSTGGPGVRIQMGGCGLEIGGRDYTVLIFNKFIGVIPAKTT